MAQQKPWQFEEIQLFQRGVVFVCFFSQSILGYGLSLPVVLLDPSRNGTPPLVIVFHMVGSWKLFDYLALAAGLATCAWTH